MKKVSKEKQEMKRTHRKNDSRGITLIALVITIIVLLILAGVSIAMLTGENGVLTKATEAKEQTEIAQEKEEIQMAYAAAKANKVDQVADDVTAGELQDELDKLNSLGEASGSGTLKVTFGDRVYTVDQETGKISGPGEGTGETPEEPDEEGEEIGTTESYVGYYADVDGDGEVDGVIYVDLADTENTSGQWNGDDWSNYEYTAVTEGLKKYKVSEETYSEFGGQWEKPIITEIQGSGEKDRFYVMALEDFKGNDGQERYCWYDAAYGKLDDIVETDENDFGKGKEKTAAMIENWNKGENGGYGAKDANGTYRDMWGIIQEEDKNGKKWDLNKWFVPSKAEWSAFGDFAYTDMGVTTGNYGNFGLSDWYWSSSQRNINSAYYANFYDGYINYDIVNSNGWVRLSATF